MIPTPPSLQCYGSNPEPHNEQAEMMDKPVIQPGLSVLCCALALLLVLSSSANAEPDFPQLTGRVVDNATLLDDSQQTALTAQLEAHEAETSNQLVVVTLPSLQGYDISDFSNRLLRHWQIGQAELDNGVLLVVAPNERKVRIEVGYGLEGALTDVTSGDIIRRQILPRFRENEYAEGVTRGVDSILSAIKGEYEFDPQAAMKQNGKQPVKHFPLLFLGIIALFEILKKFGWHKLGHSAFPTAIFGIAATAFSGNLLIGFSVSLVVFLLFFFILLPRRARTSASGQRPAQRRDSARNDYRHSSSRGFGGGGFSGGGGSGGGGGASGGW